MALLLALMILLLFSDFFGILFDFIMVFATGGIWFIWILIRYLRR